MSHTETRCARDEVVGLPERSEPEGPQGAARGRESHFFDRINRIDRIFGQFPPLFLILLIMLILSKRTLANDNGVCRRVEELRRINKHLYFTYSEARMIDFHLQCHKQHRMMNVHYHDIIRMLVQQEPIDCITA